MPWQLPLALHTTQMLLDSNQLCCPPVHYVCQYICSSAANNGARKVVEFGGLRMKDGKVLVCCCNYVSIMTIIMLQLLLCYVVGCVLNVGRWYSQHDVSVY